MVVPSDIADYISELTENRHAGINYIEGPKRYKMDDVAHAFATALGQSIRLNVVPADRIENYYASLRRALQSVGSFIRKSLKTIERNWPLASKTQL